ncbi:MAG: hypothetical protein AB1714_26995 [Acidobacteriota bacterium]
MSILVQIYEIQDPVEAETVVRLGVNRVGSVLFSAAEWKQPALRDVNRVARSLGATHSIIPLFNESDLLCRAVDYYEPHLLHFCEDLAGATALELDQLVAVQLALKARYPALKIMRTIPVGRPGAGRSIPTADLAAHAAPGTDVYLLDTRIDAQPVGGYVGITGQTCDWDVARELARDCAAPVILAGGLGPENVCDAILKVIPTGVDSCSRTNVADAAGNPLRLRKDFEKVRKFVEEVRRAESIPRRPSSPPVSDSSHRNG